MRWYYTPELGIDLSQGFDKFVKHDDTIDERLDSLLKTIMHHEQQTGQKIDSQIVTWRGIITKVSLSSPTQIAQRTAQTCSLTGYARLWLAPLRTAMGIYTLQKVFGIRMVRVR